jgi:hypothetical protein
MWVRGTNSAGVPTIYTLTPGGQPGLTTSATTTNPITTEGYGTVRGDGGRPVLHLNTWAFNLSGNFNILKNLEISPVSGTVAVLSLTGATCHLENLVLDPGTSSGPALLQNAVNCVVRRVYTKPNSAAGGGTNSFDVTGGGSLYEYCDMSGSGGQNGLQFNSGGVFRGCIFRDNHLAGVRQNGNTIGQFLGCVFWNNGTDGLQLTNATAGLIGNVVENCIFGSNAGYDLNYTPADVSANTGAKEWAKAQLRCNWFLTTGTGRYHQLPAGADDTALVVNPFVSSATGNFSLNTLPGGGAAITAAPCAVAFADGLNTANVLPGYYGTVPTPGGSTGALVLMRSLWRERTNERLYPATNSGVPDSTVDIYLDWGLQWLNRIARYHFTTDSTSLVLVANQQEYAPFQDLVELRWVRFGQRWLQKGSIERWRGDGFEWDEEPPSDPREFAQYGLNIVFRPIPGGNAVAENPTCVVRYVSTPPSITTNGPEQLPSQAYRIAVDYAAAIWFQSYPDTALADGPTGKSVMLLKEATDAAQLFAMEMSQRDIAR